MSNDTTNPPENPLPDDGRNQETHAWGSWDQLGAASRHDQGTASQYPASSSTTDDRTPHAAAAGWENTGWTPQQHAGATAATPAPDQQWNQPQGWEGTAALPNPNNPQFQVGPVAPAHSSGGIGGFFRSLFDFSFHSYITPSIVKILYVLTVLGIALGWLGSVIMCFILKVAADHSYDSSGGGIWVVLGVLDLLFGWIGAIISMAIARMQYEYMVALIRTSEYARDIKAHLTGDHRTR